MKSKTISIFLIQLFYLLIITISGCKNDNADQIIYIDNGKIKLGFDKETGSLRHFYDLINTYDWLENTALWIWNRGKSDNVLMPAEDLKKRLGLPVSVFWHWWHGCSYDDGFPEYMPPREGKRSFISAICPFILILVSIQITSTCLLPVKFTKLILKGKSS
jgi:hypothetical protein